MTNLISYKSIEELQNDIAEAKEFCFNFLDKEIVAEDAAKIDVIKTSILITTYGDEYDIEAFESISDKLWEAMGDYLFAPIEETFITWRID